MSFLQQNYQLGSDPKLSIFVNMYYYAKEKIDI